jgi:hypothetical protein
MGIQIFPVQKSTLIIKIAWYIFIPVLLLNSCVRETINSGDMQMLITEQVFSEYGIVFSGNASGKMSKKRYLDGTTRLSYSFEGYAIDSSYLSLVHTINVSPSNFKAGKKQNLLNRLKDAGTIKGVEFDPIESFHYGEVSAAYLFKEKKVPVGNLLMIQESRVTHYLLFSGIYFDDPYDWEVFFKSAIEPKIQASLKQESHY